MIDFQKIKIAVLMGGISAEREISLNSGRAAAAAMRSAGCRVEEVDVRDRQLDLPAGTDVAFIALHGVWGEDGAVQSLLEKRGVPFTGSGAEACRLALDKVAAKEVFRKAGLAVARDVVIRGRDDLKRARTYPFGFPRVVKPSREGSSIGVRIVRREEEMEDALREAMKSDDLVLVEEFIEGRELTVGVFRSAALSVVEIRPKHGWYDYANKYTKAATEYLVPAPIEEALRERVQREALEAHRALGCRDMSRADFRLDAGGKTYLLEVNTIPGMTETSLLPKSAAAAGITFPNLCLGLVEEALKRGRKIS